MANRSYHSLLRSTTLIIGLFLLAGCGGGVAPSRSLPEEYGTVTLRIHWPEVKTDSRMMPDLARSVKVWLRRHGLFIAESPVLTRPPGNADVEFRFTGVPVSYGGLRDTYAHAGAYRNDNGTGALLAYGSSAAFAVKSGSNPEQTIYLVSTVKEVRIALNPSTVRVGDTFTASASALNVTGEVVPVPTFRWRIVSGSNVVEFVGSSTGDQVTLRALRAGNAVLEAYTEQQSSKPDESRVSGRIEVQVLG